LLYHADNQKDNKWKANFDKVICGFKKQIKR